MPPSIDRKIAELDAQILTSRLLLEYQLDKEEREGKHTLLVSRGMKYRIENLERKRNALQRIVQSAPSRNMTYKMELAQRERNLEIEQKRLAELQEELAARLASVPALGSLVDVSRMVETVSMKLLLSEIKGQKQRVRNKERALANWAEKESVLVVNTGEGRGRPRSQKEYREEKKEIPEESVQFYMDIKPKKRVEDILGSSPNWNMKVETPSFVDLLATSPKPTASE